MLKRIFTIIKKREEEASECKKIKYKERKKYTYLSQEKNVARVFTITEQRKKKQIRVKKRKDLKIFFKKSTFLKRQANRTRIGYDLFPQLYLYFVPHESLLEVS